MMPAIDKHTPHPAIILRPMFPSDVNEAQTETKYAKERAKNEHA